MISIEKDTDILVCQFLADYAQNIVKNHPDNSLDEYGAFFFLQCQSEVEDFKALKLTSPLMQCTVENSERFRLLHDDNTSIELFHSCIVVCDTFAISLFWVAGTLDSKTEKYLLQNCNDITLLI